MYSTPPPERYRAIEAAVDGCCEDVPGLAHWWSNCLHLRWMLWAMCRGDDDGSPDEFDWVMQARVAVTAQCSGSGRTFTWRQALGTFCVMKLAAGTCL